MPDRLESRRGTLALLVVLGMALAGCLLTPGRFVSELDIRKDGRFTFTYSGEIHLLALSKLADMGRSRGASDTFAPQPCYAEDSSNERNCSADEVNEQKGMWEEERANSVERRRKDNESMKAMLGGIDPANPRAAEEFAARLRRQAGWSKVEYKGDGLFLVDFTLNGTLGHDFSFPTIERFPMANAFVQIAIRADGSVRVDAPGFAPASAGEPYRGMMQGIAQSEGQADAPHFPVIDGKFTIRTDGAILANNTDEGPQPDPSGQKLDWSVNPLSPAAPMALIRLTR